MKQELTREGSVHPPMLTSDPSFDFLGGLCQGHKKVTQNFSSIGQQTPEIYSRTNKQTDQLKPIHKLCQTCFTKNEPCLC